MNMLNMYRLLPFVPLLVEVCLLPYNLWTRTKVVFDKTWDVKNPLENFTMLSQCTPKTLAGRACSRGLYRQLPYVHQGNLGTQNQQEANALIDSAVDIASIAAGAAVAAIPMIKFFRNCLSTQGLGTCVYTGTADFLSVSGIQLFVGTYLISRIAKYSLVYPLANLFTADRRYFLRRDQCAQQYTEITNAINALLEKPSNDPLVLKTALTAKQFLRIAPYIEKELHTGFALDPEVAAEIVTPLKTACRHLLIHTAQKA